jgi:hypothetical protein
LIEHQDGEIVKLMEAGSKQNGFLIGEGEGK